MANIKILAFAGSTRAGSWNKKLVKLAAAGARDAGAEVTVIDLRDYPLPLYDGDCEEKEGVPALASKLRELISAQDGLLISSPEYNSSISAVLKNTIDWVSRPPGGPNPFAHKTVALMGASPGGFGGLRGLVHLRSILGNIGMIVLPEQLAIAKAHEAFDETGQLKDSKANATAAALGASVARVAGALQSVFNVPGGKSSAS